MKLSWDVSLGPLRRPNFCVLNHPRGDTDKVRGGGLYYVSWSTTLLYSFYFASSFRKFVVEVRHWHLSDNSRSSGWAMWFRRYDMGVKRRSEDPETPPRSPSNYFPLTSPGSLLLERRGVLCVVCGRPGQTSVRKSRWPLYGILALLFRWGPFTFGHQWGLVLFGCTTVYLVGRGGGRWPSRFTAHGVFVSWTIPDVRHGLEPFGAGGRLEERTCWQGRGSVRRQRLNSRDNFLSERKRTLGYVTLYYENHGCPDSTWMGINCVK